MVEPVLKEKRDHGLEESEWRTEPIRRAISEVEEEVKESVEDSVSAVSGATRKSVMPDIRGLDILKGGIYLGYREDDLRYEFDYQKHGGPARKSTQHQFPP